MTKQTIVIEVPDGCEICDPFAMSDKDEEEGLLIKKVIVFRKVVDHKRDED